MVDVVVREDSEHGPEDLLPDGGGVRGQISKDGGLDVPTPVEVLRTSAARNDAGAFGAAGCDEAFHALALLLRDQRSDARGRVERVAHPERPGEVRNGVDDLVVPGPWREDATAEVAGLPVVEQARPRESTDGLCQVRIVQHDGGALPAELEGHGSQEPSTDLADGPPGSRRAGERDLVHQWMGDKVGPDVPAAGDHVDHRWREAAGLSG